MIFLPFKGILYLMPLPTSDNPHKFIVLNDPKKSNKNQVLMVNFSTIYKDGGHDETCILEEGVHPEVTQDSFMFYGGAVIRTVLELKSEYKEQYEDGMKVDVLRKVINGVGDSDHTKPHIKRFYNEYVKNEPYREE